MTGLDGPKRRHAPEGTGKGPAVAAPLPAGPAPAQDGALPSTLVLAVIADKWTPVVLYCLSLREVRRFNELQGRIPGISKKMLVKTLRQLEADGLVERRVYPVVPPKTEYRLTSDGHRLREPIAQLCRWGEENADLMAAIAARRERQPG